MPIDAKYIEEMKELAQDECDLPVAQAALDLLAEREELLSLLREICAKDRCPECRGCPLCGWGGTPEGKDPIPGDHAPDCRLAAFLR